MLGYTEPERAFGDHRFSLKLADQRAPNSSVPVVRQDQKISEANFLTALQNNYTPARCVIQNNKRSSNASATFA